MKNFVTLLALIVSVSGIVVSLAREEVRCFVGLNAETCQSKHNGSSESPRFGGSEPTGLTQGERDRKSPETNAMEKTLNSLKDNVEQSLPSAQDKTTSKEPTVNESKPASPSDPATVPSETKTEHDAAMETPPKDQSISVNNPQEKSESSPNSAANPSTPSVPLKVEPYSPPSSGQ